MSQRKRRVFSKEDKISILEEAKSNGVKVTIEKHGIYPSTYYTWKEKYTQMGESGFRYGMTKSHLKEIRRLEKENNLLKMIVAEKELESKLKDDLLKKKYPLEKR